MSANLVVVSAVAEVAREVVTAGLLTDSPNAVVLRYDLTHAADGSGSFRRRVHDMWGVISDETGALEHACLSCMVREDLIAALDILLSERDWTTVIIALPLATTPEQMVWQLNSACADTEIDAHVAGVVAGITPDELTDDLFGDDLLRERGLAAGAVDERSVGEALGPMLDYADFIATTSAPTADELAVLRHVTNPSTELWCGLAALDAGSAAALRHDPVRARERVDPFCVKHRGEPDSEAVWTLELHSEKPFHPRRLLDQIELLGAGRIRSRGCFWVATRPNQACVWDGADGQLSIGGLGGWGSRRPVTRLVVTGLDPRDRDRVRRAFHDVVLTSHEASGDHHQWQFDDGLDAWLG